MAERLGPNVFSIAAHRGFADALVAGLTPRYDERALGIFLDNLRRYRAGEPLRNVVDKELGY